MGTRTIGLDDELLDEADVAVQTQQALENVAGVLDVANTSLADALKVTTFLEDVRDFDVVDAICETFFDGGQPARSAVGVDALPGGVVEIEAIAAR